MNSEHQQLIDHFYPELSESDQKRFDRLKEKLHFGNILDTDDESLLEILKEQYSSVGAPALNQRQLWNSLSLYNNSDCSSITRWVQTGKIDPVIQLLAGIKPGEAFPSIGSHYNFMKRLAVDPAEMEHILPKDKNKKPKQPEGSQKAQDPTPGKKTEQLAEDILNGIDNSNPAHRILRRLHYQLGILPSMECGLVPNGPILLSGDGTCLPVHADPNGTLRKDMDRSLRYYSAPLANYGWDSSKKMYYPGYSPYFLSYANPILKKDLPIDFAINPASENDSTAVLKLLSSTLDTHKDIEIKALALDAAHDNQATYEILNEYDILPVIDLSGRSKKPEEIRGHSFTDKGIPVCSENKEMRFAGYSPVRGDIKFICPEMENGLCRCSNPCSDAKAPSYYIRPEENLRYFCKIPRNSSEYKKLYNRRSCSERINKQVLVDHNLEKRGARAMYVNAFMMMLSCLDIHLSAQNALKDQNLQSA